MSTTTNATPSTTKLAGGVLYRVAVRAQAVAQGWTFTQTATGVDTFTKGDTTVQLKHGPKSIMVSAELVQGDSTTLIHQGSQKLEHAMHKMGLAADASRWVLKAAEKAALQALVGTELGTIKVIAETPDQAISDVISDVISEAIDQATKQSSEAADQPKPTPKAKQGGPTQAARQAAKDAAHIQEM